MLVHQSAESAKKMRLRHYLVSTIRVRMGRRTNTRIICTEITFRGRGTARLKCQTRRTHNEKTAVSLSQDVLQSFIVMLLSRFDSEIEMKSPAAFCPCPPDCLVCYIGWSRARDGRYTTFFAFLLFIF